MKLEDISKPTITSKSLSWPAWITIQYPGGDKWTYNVYDQLLLRKLLTDPKLGVVYYKNKCRSINTGKLSSILRDLVKRGECEADQIMDKFEKPDKIKRDLEGRQ